MRTLKKSTLGLYYYTSLPFRSARNALLAASGRAPVMILMYHRIADDQANAWTTHSDVFEQQIDWLQQRFDMISLADAQQRLREPTNHCAAVSITFDDGYAINCQRGLPLLIGRGIPFTYFVTSNAVLKGDYFQHDLVMGNRFEPNTLQQLKSLVAAGVEIGAHTRTHADLGSIQDEATLYDEVVTAGHDLAEALGSRVRYCAFPFGQHANLNRRGFEMAAECGYEAVVSAYGGYNFPGDDTFHMQRMGVDGPMIRLKNWTTFDPFKQWKIPRYEYRSPAGSEPKVDCPERSSAESDQRPMETPIAPIRGHSSGYQASAPLNELNDGG